MMIDVKPSMPTPAPLDHAFAALANPTRRAILVRLGRGEATVTKLAAPFALSQPSISSHLRILEEAGLMTRALAANTRPVRLSAAPMAGALRWLGGFEGFWAGNLDRLEACVKSLQHKEKSDGDGNRGRPHGGR